MARKPVQIDRDKLSAEVRKLRTEYVFSMLNDAIELLPLAKLDKMVLRCFQWNRTQADPLRF